MENAQIDRNKLEDVLKARMTGRLLAEKPGATLVRTEFSLEQSETGAWLGILEAELVETTGMEVPIE